MTSTILIIVLIAVPLGFLAGQLLLGRGRQVRIASAQVVKTEKPKKAPVQTEPADPWDSIVSSQWDSVTPGPSNEAMAGKIERLRAERNDLRDRVHQLERSVSDLETEIEGNSAQLSASALQVQRAEEVSRNAGGRLVEALAERDEAVERLQLEKAAHAETHRILEGAENYLQVLVGHLDGTSNTDGRQTDLASQVAELRDTVGRLGQQLQTNDQRVPTARR